MQTQGPVKLNFNVIAGRESQPGPRVVDRERFWQLLPIFEEEVGRQINKILAEIVAGVNSSTIDNPYSSEMALQECYKLASWINMRNEFRVSAALDPTNTSA